jgi:hypothetical protein
MFLIIISGLNGRLNWTNNFRIRKDMAFAEGWKFRNDTDSVLKIIHNRALWFSQPDKFNDPFDCNVDILKTFEVMLSESDFPHPEDFPGYIAAIDSHMRSHSYAYLCLCKNWKQSLMWSHYANGHKGVALGFSFSNESEFQMPRLSLRPISYDSGAFIKALKHLANASGLKKSFPTCSPGLMAGEGQGLEAQYFECLINSFEIVRNMKSECWHYEEEMRYELELESSGSPGIMRKFSPDDLKHVIFGIKCLDEDKSKILSQLDTCDWSHLKFWQAKPDNVKMLVCIEPILTTDDNFPNIQSQ